MFSVKSAKALIMPSARDLVQCCRVPLAAPFAGAFGHAMFLGGLARAGEPPPRLRRFSRPLACRVMQASACRAHFDQRHLKIGPTAPGAAGEELWPGAHVDNERFNFVAF